MIKTQITIASQTVDCFLSDAQEYLYSLTSAADLLNKEANSAFSFLESKAFKATLNNLPESLQSQGLTTFKIPKEGGGYYTLVPSWVIIKYLSHHAIRNGNELAMVLLEALAMESLDVRSMRAFDNLTPEAYDAKVEKTDSQLEAWMKARLNTMNVHQTFCLAYKAKKHPGAKVHDRITKLINGQTAAEAREGQLVADELDPTIGLNYVNETTRLQAIALAKMEYAKLIAGTWEDQAQRAVNSVLKQMRQLIATL